MGDQQAKPISITTTNAGALAPSDEHALTAGPGGPVLLQDSYLNEKLAHFVRERIPDLGRVGP
jgi:catalase